MNIYRSHVLICGGTGCTSSGSVALQEEFETRLKENGLEIVCDVAPISARLIVNPASLKLKKNDIDKIIDSIAQTL